MKLVHPQHTNTQLESEEGSLSKQRYAKLHERLVPAMIVNVMTSEMCLKYVLYTCSRVYNVTTPHRCKAKGFKHINILNVSPIEKKYDKRKKK